MATESWTNNTTGEVRSFTDGETFVMLRTTEGTKWKKGLSSSEFVVCIAIAEEMTKRGRVSVTKGWKKRIAEDSGITERAVYDAVRKLVNKNILAYIGGGDYLMNPEVFYSRSSRGVHQYLKEYYAERNKSHNKTDENKKQRQ